MTNGRRKIGFLDGVRAPFGGLRFVLSTPGTWGWALVPMLVVAVAVAAFAWGGLALVAHAESSWGWLARAESFWRSLARIVVEILAVAIAIFVGYFLAVPLSGFALERIVKKRERALGAPLHDSVATTTAIVRSIGASLASLLLAFVAFVALTVVDVFAPPATVVTSPLRVILASIALSWDVLDYPLAMRPMSLRSRIAWFFKHFSASLGFGLALWVLFFVPGANLLLLPAGVAGAAKLVVDSER